MGYPQQPQDPYGQSGPHLPQPYQPQPYSQPFYPPMTSGPYVGPVQYVTVTRKVPVLPPYQQPPYPPQMPPEY